jgi:hypothetical protein
VRRIHRAAHIRRRERAAVRGGRPRPSAERGTTYTTRKDATRFWPCFAGIVDSADEVVTRIGFDGQGFLFDGELFLLDGMPEGDAGSFSFDPSESVIVMTGAHGEAQVTYEWTIDGDSLTLTAIEECVVAAAEVTCLDDRSEMDPVMLLVTDQTFTRSGDDPGY